jgi:hypothetical protein
VELLFLQGAGVLMSGRYGCGSLWTPHWHAREDLKGWSLCSPPTFLSPSVTSGAQSDLLPHRRPVVPGNLILAWRWLVRSPLALSFSFSGENDVELGPCLGPAEDRNPEAPGRVIQSFICCSKVGASSKWPAGRQVWLWLILQWWLLMIAEILSSMQVRVAPAGTQGHYHFLYSMTCMVSGRETAVWSGGLPEICFAQWLMWKEKLQGNRLF